MHATAARANGFDVLRLGLAAAVVFFHGVTICGGHEMSAWFLMPMHLVLPMFFAISGFLVAGSLERAPSLAAFLALRGLRILPALALAVTLTAFVLGAALTTRPLIGYFASPAVPGYLLALVGDVQYGLPGVFDQVPRPGIVNGALWTIPLECLGYLSLAAMAGLVRRPWLFAALTGGAITAIAVSGDAELFGAIPGGPLMACFMAGAVLQRCRVPMRAAPAAVSAGLALWLMSATPALGFAGAVPAAYLAVWLGQRRLPFRVRADYSYGLYLSAFPLQQCYVMALPQFRVWWVDALAGIAGGLLYAAFSWHAVEGPLLARKRQLVAWVERASARIRTRRPSSARPASSSTPSAGLPSPSAW